MQELYLLLQHTHCKPQQPRADRNDLFTFENNNSSKTKVISEGRLDLQVTGDKKLKTEDCQTPNQFSTVENCCLVTTVGGFIVQEITTYNS